MLNDIGEAEVAVSSPDERFGRDRVEGCMKRHKITSLVALMTLAGFVASPLLASEKSQEALKAQAKISEAQARETAMNKAPGGLVKSSELEKEHGKLIWSFDIATPKSKNITEVQVDAKTGKIVSIQSETPADQAKESQADKKSKK